jgi:endogenous inhibitor of DNA gyrase (YacG/DUF329 family)
MSTITVKCPICGKPYKFMMFSANDQSACPSCVREAEKNGELRPFQEALKTFEREFNKK